MVPSRSWSEQERTLEVNKRRWLVATCWDYREHRAGNAVLFPFCLLEHYILIIGGKCSKDDAYIRVKICAMEL